MITSYSQVKNAEECIRLYAFSSWGGRYEERGKQQGEGDDLHSHVEGHIAYGLPFDLTSPLARLASLAQEYFPTRADEPLIEHEELVTYGNHQWRAKPDLLWLAPRGPICVDHKTVDHYRFALTKPKLRMALQPCTYAYRAMQTYGTDRCTVLWIYYKRTAKTWVDEQTGRVVSDDPEPIRVVETDISFDDAIRVLRARQSLVDYMAELKLKKPNPLSLPANKARCKKYGDKRPCYNLPVCFPEEVQAHDGL